MVNGFELLPRLSTAAGLFLLVGCGSSSGTPENSRSGPFATTALPQQALTGQQLESALLHEEDFHGEVRRDSDPLAGQLLAVNPGLMFLGLEPDEGADLSSDQQSCLNALTRESRVVDSALDASAEARYVFAPNIEVSVVLSSSAVEPPNAAELWAQWLEPCEDVDGPIETDMGLP